MRILKLNTKSPVWTPGNERVLASYFSEEKGHRITYEPETLSFHVVVGTNPDNYVDIGRENAACWKAAPRDDEPAEPKKRGPGRPPKSEAAA